MELGTVCTFLVGGALLYAVLQFVRFLRGDADLTLLWAEQFGVAPEKILFGKVIWITGASSGIGEELAYQLAKIGALLVLSARRKNELQRVKQKCLEISRLKEENVLVLRLDLMDRKSHESATEAVVQHFGRIDVLVNNGGRTQRSRFVDASLEVYEELIQLNYLGTISLTKHVLRHMMEAKKGKIVTVNSVAGFMGVALASGYVASKYALQGFFNTLRIELYKYPEITITNICPGPVQSHAVDNAYAEGVTKTPKSEDQSYKMPTERCVKLMLVSMANNLLETWISDHLYLSLCYLWHYAPTWAWRIGAKLGRRRMENVKDGVGADSSYFTKRTKRHNPSDRK